MCNRIINRLSISWVLLFIVINAHAQRDVLTYPKPYYQIKAERIGTEKGLSQGYGNCLGIDKEGFLWVSSMDGLNRYDGTEFKVFKNDVNDTNTIRGNSIYQFLIDSKDRIWVMDDKGEVDLYDRQTERFIHVRIPPSIILGEGNLEYRFLVEDYLGRIISGSQNGIFVINKIQQSKVKTTFNIVPISEVYPNIVKLIQDEGSIINSFLSDNRLMICRLSHKSVTLGDSSPHAIFTQEILKERAEPIYVTLNKQTILHAANHLNGYKYGVYIFGEDGVLQVLNDKKECFDTLLTLPKGKYDFLHALIDNDNLLWIFQSPELLLRTDIVTGKTDSIKIVRDGTSGSANGNGACFLKDNTGNIWVGTNGVGLIKLNTKQTLFRHLDTHAATQRLSQFRMAVAGNGKKLDIKTSEMWARFNQNNDRNNAFLNKMKYAFFYAQAKDGVMYFKTTFMDSSIDVICKANMLNSTITPLYKTDFYKTEWLGEPTFLDNNDELWLGDRYKGRTHNLYHLNKNNGQLTQYRIPAQFDNAGSRFISDWHITPNNIFWLATRQGLYSFDPGSKKWNSFRNKPGDTNTISQNYLLAVCPDAVEPDKYLWLGTKGGGLNKLDITTGKALHYTAKQGLPNNVVYGVQTDHLNNIWLSTNNGLCFFNTTTEETYNFSVEDGLPGSEFNSYQYAKDDSGQMFFAGVDGAILFYPKAYYATRVESKTIINKLKLLNKEVQYSYTKLNDNTGGYILHKPIEQSKELVFNYDDRMITLGFAVLDYTTPHKNKFKYILEGLHKEWIDAGMKNEATFSGLSPGKYTFKVVGRNSSGVWSKQPAIMYITIQPPWWGTWWFRVAVLLAIAGILYVIYRYRVAQMLKVERMRNDIAQDLHDEIGSTLSSISLYSTIIKRNSGGLSDKLVSLVDKITKNTSEMMESMNDIVWTTKTNNDTLSQLIIRMRAFAAATTEAKGIKLQFSVHGKVEQMNIGMAGRKNLYMLFKEAVNNAIKHSDCDKIDITIKSEGKRIDMTIKDNGKGFDADKTESNESMGGNGLSSMRSRAETIGAQLKIESSIDNGTTITLSMHIK